MLFLRSFPCTHFFFFFCCRYFILKYRTSSKVQWKTSRANNNSRCWRCVSYTRALHMDGKSTTSSWNWNHNVRNLTHKKLQHSQYIVCMEKMTQLMILELLVVFLIDWVVEWCIVLFFSASYEITIWHHQYANTDLIKNVGESFDMNSAFFEL